MKSDVEVVSLEQLPELGEVLIEGPIPYLDSSQRALVGFSVRNRNFDEDFFRSSFSFIEKYCKEGLVTIFDEPYSFNDAADRGTNSPTESEFKKNIRIGDERERMVRRILNSIGARNIRVERWHTSNAHPMVDVFREEIRLALDQSKEFRAAMSSYSEAWVGQRGSLGNIYYLEFLIQEIPVLLALYYVRGFSVDLYPGRNIPFYKDLEEGRWSNLLEQAYLHASNKHLTFVTLNKRSPSVV